MSCTSSITSIHQSCWLETSAKYVLAIVNQLIDILGSKVGCAYNIGCAFMKTLKNSSLSEKAKNALFCLIVGAFHGHAHNWACQLNWHPLYIKGTSHSEGEGYECILVIKWPCSRHSTCHPIPLPSSHQGTLCFLGSRQICQFKYVILSRASIPTKLLWFWKVDLFKIIIGKLFKLSSLLRLNLQFYEQNYRSWTKIPISTWLWRGSIFLICKRHLLQQP